MKRLLNGLKIDNYSSPKCLVSNVLAANFVCGSPIFGNDNEAGSDMEEDDNHTYNY